MHCDVIRAPGDRLSSTQGTTDKLDVVLQVVHQHCELGGGLTMLVYNLLDSSVFVGCTRSGTKTATRSPDDGKMPK